MVAVLEYLTSPEGALAFILSFAVVTGVAAELLNARLMRWVRTQPWLQRMIPLQRNMMLNFGFPESACSDEMCLEMYCIVLIVCGNHLVMGLAMAPVAALGWEAAGEAGRLLFVMGGLGDVAYCVYDWIKCFCRTFLPETCQFWGAPFPMRYFVVLCVLHHTASMSLTVPMLTCHPEMREFHLIGISLLLAAAICFLTGAYKFTLNTRLRFDMLQYKAIVLVQLVTIWFTRAGVWFTQAFSLISTFYARGETAFFIGAVVAGLLMSVFNIVMLMDATTAARKWLPRPLPVEHHTAAQAQKDKKAERDAVHCHEASPARLRRRVAHM